MQILCDKAKLFKETPGSDQGKNRRQEGVQSKGKLRKVGLPWERWK